MHAVVQVLPDPLDRHRHRREPHGIALLCKHGAVTIANPSATPGTYQASLNVIPCLRRHCVARRWACVMQRGSRACEPDVPPLTDMSPGGKAGGGPVDGAWPSAASQRAGACGIAAAAPPAASRAAAAHFSSLCSAVVCGCTPVQAGNRAAAAPYKQMQQLTIRRCVSSVQRFAAHRASQNAAVAG